MCIRDRDNTQKMVWGKNILLLLSSVSTGKTINRSLECLRYYSGRLVGIAAIFSAIGESNGIPVNAIFTKEDLPHYETSLSTECALCKSCLLYTSACRFMNALKLAAIAIHVADLRTCVLHPASTTHRQLNDQQLAEAGVTPDLILSLIHI